MHESAKRRTVVQVPLAEASTPSTNLSKNSSMNGQVVQSAHDDDVECEFIFGDGDSEEDAAGVGAGGGENDEGARGGADVGAAGDLLLQGQAPPPVPPRRR